MAKNRDWIDILNDFAESFNEPEEETISVKCKYDPFDIDNNYRVIELVKEAYKQGFEDGKKEARKDAVPLTYLFLNSYSIGSDIAKKWMKKNESQD